MGVDMYVVEFNVESATLRRVLSLFPQLCLADHYWEALCSKLHVYSPEHAANENLVEAAEGLVRHADAAFKATVRVTLCDVVFFLPDQQYIRLLRDRVPGRYAVIAHVLERKVEDLTSVLIRDRATFSTHPPY